MENKTPNTKRGRPKINIEWPDTQSFTAQDVLDFLGGKVSRVTVHNKLKEGIEMGNLEKVGLMKSVNGRPKIVYSMTVSDEVTETEVNANMEG